MDNQITTDLLRFMWSNAEDFKSNFRTFDNREVGIIHCGDWNVEEGIDFLYATVKWGDQQIRNGSVKFFNRSSEWDKWQEQNFLLSRTVSLVVVYEYNDPIFCDGGEMPIIQGIISPDIMERYLTLITSKGAVCIDYFKTLSSTAQLNIFEWLTIDRLQAKYLHVQEAHQSCGEGNWGHTFTLLLFDTIAITKSNRKRFCRLAKEIHYNKIINQLSSLEEVEALLFGVSGLLTRAGRQDDYVYRLRNIYTRLAAEYHLQEMDGMLWCMAYSGNTNTLYLTMARIAAILFEGRMMAYELPQQKSLDQIRAYFKKEVSPYWKKHTAFGVNEWSEEHSNELSDDKIDLMIINCVIPFLYGYHKESSLHFDQQSDLLIDFLFEIKGENNNFIRSWKNKGVAVDNAFTSQAIIQLTKLFCNKEGCARCRLAREMLIQ